MSNKITSFVDSVGRVIVARLNDEESTDTQLAVTNPAVVNINVNQEDGQISVQLLPYIFREFLTAETRYEKHTWRFNKCQITSSDEIEIDDAVKNQYVGIFETVPAPAAPVTTDGEVVEMFDDAKATDKKSNKSKKATATAK